jgi:hypothetical protein
MLTRVIRSLLCVMLSATLLTGSVMFPGYRHAHACGNDMSHKHANFSTTLASLVDHNECPNCGAHCRGCRINSMQMIVDSVSDHASHFHLTWFGFQLTLPDSSTPTNENNNESDNQWVCVRGSNYFKVASQQNFRVEKLSIPVYQRSPLQNLVEIHVADYFSRPVTLTLLCDRARHERSGVQLT